MDVDLTIPYSDDRRCEVVVWQLNPRAARRNVAALYFVRKELMPGLLSVSRAQH
jgi:hypothetical protein